MKKKAAEKADKKKATANKLSGVEAAKNAVKQRQNANKPKNKIVDLWIDFRWYINLLKIDLSFHLVY